MLFGERRVGFMSRAVGIFQNRLRALIVALPALLLFSTLPAFGTTRTVTNTNDSGDGSLRAAISAAASGDTIEFSSSITYPATITLTSGQLNIDKSLTIVGPGASELTIDGDNTYEIFHIFSYSSGLTVSISGLTIADGNAGAGQGGGVYSNTGAEGQNNTLTLTDCAVTGNSASSGGGGIFNQGGVLTLTDSTVSDNSDSGSNSGGGIYSTYGTVTLINSTVSGNSDSGSTGAGGIYNQAGTLTIDDSTISDNSASGFYGGGGGIFSTPVTGSGGTTPSTLTITDSTVSGNSASGDHGGGGGIYNAGTATIAESTISGNSATSGGGIFNTSPGTVTITNATISGNSDNSSGRGGGIYNGGGTVTLSNSTVAGNLAYNFVSDGGVYNYSYAHLTIKNTILSKGYGDNCDNNYGGVFTSLGYNLSDDGSCSSLLTQTGDHNSTSAGLSTAGLQDNGGPTKTIAVLSGSAAVDAIPETACKDVDGNPVNYDQRGIPRPQGEGCDIGAYELEENTPFSFSTLKLNIRAESTLPPRPPSFDLTSTFTLGAGTNGIDPLTEAVYLEVGEPGVYSVTIPAGSFHELAHGKKVGSYVFSGVIDGVSLSVQIVPLGLNTYEFKANGSPADLTELTNPVTVTVSIGDDIGTKTDVTAKFLP